MMTSPISISTIVNPNAERRAHESCGPVLGIDRLVVGCDCRVMTDPHCRRDRFSTPRCACNIQLLYVGATLRSLRPPYMRCNGCYGDVWSLLTTNSPEPPESLKPLEQQAPAARAVRSGHAGHVERLNDGALRVIERRVTAQGVDL